MDDDKYLRNVELRCPTCGGSQFEFDDRVDPSQATVHCIGCILTMTKEELLRGNAASIEEHAREIAEEAPHDLAMKLKTELKKAFRGSRDIKIK